MLAWSNLMQPELLVGVMDGVGCIAGFIVGHDAFSWRTGRPPH